MSKLDQLLAKAVEQCVADGQSVELDGVGRFEADRTGGIGFVAESGPRVFIAYVCEDVDLALRLADELTASGMRVWIDKRRLMPGQHWRRAIDRAIERADFFVACFTKGASRKRGQFPYELRAALRSAERMPIDDMFLIPVRMEPCDVPHGIAREIQYVDLFPDWKGGVRRLIRSINDERNARRLRDAA